MKAVRITMRHRSIYGAGVSLSWKGFRRRLPVSPTASWSFASSSRSSSSAGNPQLIWTRSVCGYEKYTHMTYPYSTSGRNPRFFPQSCLTRL